MLIDTHAHVNFVAYKDDGDEVIKRALQNNVWLINVGSQYDTSCRSVQYAQKYPEGVYASVALHPIHLKGRKIRAEVDPYELIEFETQEEKFDFKKYKELAQNPKVVAIGETGLDYYHLKSEPPEEIDKIKNLQKEVFLQDLFFLCTLLFNLTHPIPLFKKERGFFIRVIRVNPCIGVAV